MEVDKRKEWGGEDKESHCNTLKVRANILLKNVKFHPAQCPIDGLTCNEGCVLNYTANTCGVHQYRQALQVNDCPTHPG